ncbi:STAS/SEC14 domain-containing protein [Fulvivirga sp. 29W222]|uniref:STAS/SEC14 domain-containing protein n=1 Tax=Fulvivirga marina TaxID=2494733 RepID=A0A937FWF2_9BACT|nr:STAS/SEC14 domain-containing protein [Fulvivirga marina]MBL6445620.1 STAS/SEC14 domain-containing protein [Fulvivirga marina]
MILSIFNDFERVAIVGDKQWLEWGAKFAKPFTSAEVKYFDMSEKVEAMQWVILESNVH